MTEKIHYLDIWREKTTGELYYVASTKHYETGNVVMAPAWGGEHVEVPHVKLPELFELTDIDLDEIWQLGDICFSPLYGHGEIVGIDPSNRVTVQFKTEMAPLKQDDRALPFVFKTKGDAIRAIERLREPTKGEALYRVVIKSGEQEQIRGFYSLHLAECFIDRNYLGIGMVDKLKEEHLPYRIPINGDLVVVEKKDEFVEKWLNSDQANEIINSLTWQVREVEGFIDTDKTELINLQTKIASAYKYATNPEDLEQLHSLDKRLQVLIDKKRYKRGV